MKDIAAFFFALTAIAFLGLVLKGCGSSPCVEHPDIPGQCVAGAHWEVH
jgi:hypothetical protein